MYENCLYGLNIIIDNKITNAIYDLIFLDFISFLLKIGIFSVSAGAYLAIMIILNIVINPANI
mgnify:CR=1 FL=1